MMAALLEAFTITAGGSEGGIGRVCAETLCGLETRTGTPQVTIITSEENPPLPKRGGVTLITIPKKPPWLKLAYKIGNSLKLGALNEAFFLLRYKLWLAESKREAAALHKQTPFDFAIHATYTNLSVGSRLGESGIPTVSLGSFGGAGWERAAARLNRRGRGVLLGLNRETCNLLNAIPCAPPIEIPKPAGNGGKNGRALFIDHTKKRKNAAAVKEALKAPTPSPNPIPVTVLTNRPEYWERTRVTTKPKASHEAYLKELEAHSYLLTVASREGAPTSALEGLHLGTIPIASPLTWTQPLETIRCGTEAKTTPKDIAEALLATKEKGGGWETEARNHNRQWGEKHTGHKAFEAALKKALEILGVASY